MAGRTKSSVSAPPASTGSPSAQAGLDPNARREYWYSLLTLFPFAFIPIVAILAVLSGLIVPYFSASPSP